MYDVVDNRRMDEEEKFYSISDNEIEKYELKLICLKEGGKSLGIGRIRNYAVQEMERDGDFWFPIFYENSWYAGKYKKNA